jgi:uncharacterized protein (DUF885 family)
MRQPLAPLARSLCLAGLALAASCSPAPTREVAAPAPVTSPDQRFEALVAEFMPAFWAQNPGYAIYSGVYDHAAVLEPYDAAARAKEAAFADRWLARLDAFDPAELSPGNRSDRELIRGALKGSRWYLDVFRSWQWQPTSYNVAGAFEVLINTEYAPLDARLRTISQRLAAVPAYYAAAQANIATPSLEHTDLAITQNKGALGTFSDALIAKARASGLTDPEKAEFERRVLAAREAVAGYVRFLEALRPDLGAGPSESNPRVRSFRIGKELYDQKFLVDNVTGFTADGLYQRALAEKAWLHDQMAARAAKLWAKRFPGKQPPADRLVMIRQLLDELSLDHIQREDFVSAVRAQIPELERFVAEHDLLDQDPTRPLKVRETPPYQRGFGALASVDAPGPYDPTRDTFYNVTPLDEFTPAQAESFLREYNRWMLQILNIHEAVPGHYTQLMHANKSKSIVKSVFGDGAMIEGWAVYGERMMLDAGYGGGTDEMWLFWMKWNLRAVCNTILDYAIHTQGMTREQMMDLLQREAFQQEAEASQKWRRATQSSVQLTSYFAGYAAIWQFHEEERARLGDRFSIKAFNNEFLSYGSAPVPVIKALVNEKPGVR